MAPPRIRKVFSGFAPDLQIDLKGPCSRLNTFWPFNPRTPPEHHKIIKTHRIFIIFLYFIGNYVTCKNYTHTKKNLFIHLTRSHFSLISKTHVALGTLSLLSSAKDLLDLSLSFHNYISFHLHGDKDSTPQQKWKVAFYSIFFVHLRYHLLAVLKLNNLLHR